MAKILVADDNSNIQKMVGLALKDQGIEVVAVGNGEAAVRKIADVKPDLILADVFMPVRNGYEVCRYVKENSDLAHIPVILLVGAFDPLDEQEAQRVCADGVLKKPFVPPDPLISMVKSALARAGVSVGTAPAPAEKPAPTAPPQTTEFLKAGVSSRLAAWSAEALPEAPAEPLEEFAPPSRTPVRFTQGQEPVAFGSMLDTPETDTAVTSKPMIELGNDRKWTEETNDVLEEEEDEEESPKPGWRPGALEEEVEPAASSAKGVADWRDEAFHGSSPASSPTPPWERAVAVKEPLVAAPVTSAVTAVESKPETGAPPFTGDAWAAAMAAGVEKKVEALTETGAALPEASEIPAVTQNTLEQALKAVSGLPDSPAGNTESVPEIPSWSATPGNSWEAEAKRASQLASTWDTVVPQSAEETHTPSSEETQEVSAYAKEEEIVPAEPIMEQVAAESSPYARHEDVAEPAFEHAAAGESLASPAAENAPDSDSAGRAQAAETEMDQLVAKVLGKMNPDVLQKVTREILKPVIEAIVRDELKQKNS